MYEGRAVCDRCKTDAPVIMLNGVPQAPPMQWFELTITEDGKTALLCRTCLVKLWTWLEGK